MLKKWKKMSRNQRFESFDLAVDSELQINLKTLVFELQNFFPSIPIELQQIDRIIDDFLLANDETLEMGESPTENPLYAEKFIVTVRSDLRCLEILKSIRSYMEEGSRHSEMTNWDLIVSEGFKVDSYLTLMYSLMRLHEVDPRDKLNRDLSFNAGRTYICLLGLPGAKRSVWDQDVIVSFFKLFEYTPNKKNCSNSDYEDHYLEIQVLQMLNECKTAFNIVCLNDQREVMEKYIETLSVTLENFMASDRYSAFDILMKCYDNFESLCLKPLPDKDIESIMFLIFCRTVDLHFITPKKCSRYTNNGKHGESISDFFLHLLTNYFEKTKNVLMKFVKSLLSNLDHKFEKDKFQKLIEVAVKYELAIYLKSKDSILNYLEKLSLASDHRQRLNGIEFCGKMLTINSTPDSSFHQIALEVPREASIIKILFEKVYDKQDNVKLRALTVIKNGIQNGNDFTKKIFGIVFKQKSETDDNPEIREILGKEAGNFQRNLLSLLQNSQSTYIKKVCLEILAHNCENIIDDEIFIDTITSLSDDPSYLVKIQLLDVINSLVVSHAKNPKILEMWLDIVLDLVKDNENKIVEAAVKSLTGIFQKIESFENTVSEIQMLPWNVIRLIMKKNKRGLLQSTMSTVTTNFLTQDKLRKIETHIFTPHKTEAWCILSIVSKRMKSNNPDIVVKTFLDQIDRFEEISTHDITDFNLILEVIRNWLDSFNNTSKTQIVIKSSKMLENGSCPITLLHHVYEICTLARSILFDKSENVKFVKSMNDKARKIVLENTETFTSTSMNEKVLSHMLLYCETSTDLVQRPDKNCVDFFFSILKKVVGDRLRVTQEHDIPRKLNCVIVILTRFALRDNEMASELTPKLAMLLRKNPMHISVVKTTMQCLNDLCKKHTSTVAPVFKEIIYKLHSHNEEIRLCALSNIYDLVMQDFIKMKGRVLSNFLACLVDKNEIIQLKSQAAILSYTNDKNSNLLYTCFLESVYVFNDYVQPDNFGVFPLDEIDREYKLLHGAENRSQRYELYNFFVQNIHDINEAHLLMLLKQIIVIKEKLEKSKFKKTANGTETFKDLLYIFKLICEKRGESKINVSKPENSECLDDENEESAENAIQQPQKSAAGRKKQMTISMNDAIPIVEKVIAIFPAFSKFMFDFDSKLKTSIDELSLSIAQNFSSFIEFSNNPFWVKLSQPNTRTRRQKKATKRTHTEDNNEIENDSSE